jgi:dolichyl-phosphate-mannose-protein mannosyltransferase
VIYLSAADRLVEGKGLTPIGYHFDPAMASDRPLVIFPPAYPLLLASTSLFNGDRLTGAKYIHSFLFAANVFLLGLIVYISCRSIWAALCAMGLFQTSYPLLSVYTMVRAEPLFMFFLLCTMLAMVFYNRRAELWLLLISASTAAAALLTRYAAVVILIPLVLTVLIQNGPSRASFRRAVLVGTVALLPIVGWLIRNRLIAGSSTRRSLAFHSIGTVAVKTFFESLMLLVTPYVLPGLVKVLLLAIAAIVVVYALTMGLRYKTETTDRCVRFFSAAMVASYVMFIAAYNSFANPAVDLGPRVALPVYVFGMILVFSFVQTESALRKRRAFSWCIIFSSFVLFVANVRPAAYWISYTHREGQGFTSRAWKDSETVKFVKALPSQMTIYSNAADACYLFTKREALRLPAKYDPTGARVNTDFAAQMTEVRDDLNHDSAVVVYFDRVTWRWYLPDRNELEDSHKLPVLTRLADGVVYGTQSAILKIHPDFQLKPESRVEPLREGTDAPARTRDASSPSRARL